MDRVAAIAVAGMIARPENLVANFSKQRGRAGRQKPGHGGAPRHGGDAAGRPHGGGAAGRPPQRSRPPGKDQPSAGKDRRPAKGPPAVRRLMIAGRESYYEQIIKDARQRNVPVETLPWEDFLALGQFDESEKHQG